MFGDAVKLQDCGFSLVAVMKGAMSGSIRKQCQGPKVTLVLK